MPGVPALTHEVPRHRCRYGAAMTTASTNNPQPRPRGHVKWRRLALILIPAAVVTATLVGLTANGAIAASMSVSGQEFLVTASQLNGTGFEQFGGQISGASGPRPVIISAIHQATL